jgi:AraC-like DNA-binding protein
MLTKQAPSQSAQFFLGLLAYAAQRDLSPEQLCLDSGIDLPRLQQEGDYQPTLKQLDDLWTIASQQSHDPLLGLHFGESLQLTALGIVGEIIKYSRTLGEALTTAAGLTPSVTNFLHVDVSKSKRNITIWLIPHHTEDSPLPFSHRQTVDAVMAFILHELDGLLLTKILPKAVFHAYAHSQPTEYARVFRQPPVKRGMDFSILLDKDYWDKPLITTNYSMQRSLLQKVRADMTTSADCFGDRIYHHLLSNAYRGILSEADVAANINMSARSLQRRLQGEQTSFSTLADRARKSLALHYLQSGEHSLKEISDMLGYNEFSAFSRAFKRWTGQGPKSFLQ